MKLRIKETSEIFNRNLINELNSLEVANGYSKTSYELIEQYENIIKQFDKGTVISFERDAGTDSFRKVNNDFYCWESSIAPHYRIIKQNDFDVASWLASRGTIERGPIVLGTDVNIDKEGEKAKNWSVNNKNDFSFIKR